jgi:O-methyltransferase
VRTVLREWWRRVSQQKDVGNPASGIPARDGSPAIADLKAVDSADQAIVERALPYTMVGVPRLLAVIDAVRFCVGRGIPGAFAECGVWRGGSVMAMVLTLQEMGSADREIYLYDTFEGMTAPSEHDTSKFDQPAVEAWLEAEERGHRIHDELFNTAVFNEEDVRATLLATGYPEERLHFVKGPVEETIPSTIPGSLALLRLDTDWYESTLHELRHLYPLLAVGGVLIIDDYGHWEGCRRAVDEYFAEHPAPLLTRIDYTGRVGVKS